MNQPTGSIPSKPALPWNDNHRKVLDLLKRMGAVSPERGKTPDDIAKLGKIPKGKLVGWLHELERMKPIESVARHKSHAYFLRPYA
jgi:hypothetical protein